MAGRRSLRYTLAFAAAVCVVCSLVVSTSAVVLRPRQEENAVLSRQRRVLAVSGLAARGEPLGDREVERLFREHMRPVLVALRTGRPDPAVSPEGFDPRRAARDPASSSPAPENEAGIQRLPDHALVYHVVEEGEVTAIILPIEGKGLWSTMLGYLAMSTDGDTILGITFYEHGETPGLGSDVEDPRWQRAWRDRRAYGPGGEPAIEVIKGRAGPPATDPHRVDGISGATLTGRGVSELVRFWLGPDGFGPYLEGVRREGGIP